MARKFESDYRLRETDDILWREDAIHRDLDLRLDAVEQDADAFRAGNRLDVDAILAAMQGTFSGLAAQMQAIIDATEGNLTADVITETATRVFLTEARRAAILAELRGDAEEAGDTLGKLLALVLARATFADVSTAVAAVVDGAPSERNTLKKVSDALNTLTAGADPLLDTFAEVASKFADVDAAFVQATSALAARLRFDAAQTLTATQSRQARANAKAEPAGFREGTYTALATGQYIAAADEGRAFTWAIASGQIGLPLGSTVYPGWSCQIRFTGSPVGFGQSTVVTAGYADAFRFNGRAQFVDTSSTNKGFVVVGGGEEFRFTWAGAEWLVERVQSPTVGHLTFNRYGVGGYVAAPTAFTAITGNSTSGTNTAAASPYNLGFYAPCDGLYRLQAHTRFLNDGTGNPAGAIALASTSAADADDFDGAPYRSFPAGEYADVSAKCTKRLAFGQVVAGYKIATATTLKTSGVYEGFFAELISRG